MSLGKVCLRVAFLSAALLVAACGDAEKKLDAAEKREERLKEENTELKVQSASLLNGFKRAVVGDGTVWVLANFNVTYADAQTICAKMSYELPTDTELARLTEKDPASGASQLISSLKSSSDADLRQIHLRDKTQDLQKGVAMCRKSSTGQ